jgi:hypothetical protein
MLRNVLIAITAAVLLGTISLLAAEKVKEKKAKEKLEQQQAYEQPKAAKGLLDELIAAYQANDREKMGQIIQKMEQRREKGQKFAKFNRWHERAHQQMDMRGPGQSAFSETSPKGGQRGWGAWHGLPAREDMARPPCCCCGKNGWGPPAREYRQMPGCDQGKRLWREGVGERGCGNWTPGPGQRFGPEFNPERQPMPGFGPYGGERPMPPRDNPSPDAEW